jgi:FemAB-related protein (PEP-CTERM system-associated)
MKIEIKTLTSECNNEWDDYVHNHLDGTFFHLSGWCNVLEMAFGHSTYFIYATSGSKILGILPLGRIKSRLFSDSLISLPFSVYAGVLAENDEVKRALIKKAISIAKDLGVETLELRHEKPVMTEWSRKSFYVTFKKELDPEVEKNLTAIPRKQRAMVRKGIKNGLKGEEDTTIDRLYEAYSESVRNLGTPVFSRRYLEILKQTFAEKCRVLSITDSDGNLVASVMSFYFKDHVLPYYGGSKSNARALAGNDFMYWELMKRSAEEGVRVFDYGRSKEGTGSYRFKKHWGFEPVPLNYEVKLIRADEIPEINPLNPKYQLFIKLWKKLPLSVANTIGPFLAKSLG